ncbi:PEP-CTERM sorting domain-containing protein [Dechloromonas sp. A34]|uniref:PEP-CTERM sorting domain-containing protein n=1 Tax=Dechloromonas sp. A34 TaxID=447588 RepID=UPI0022498C89|nr:PEP-CTERM sorting domain-containing protein [Dechloromonas sp. A34]
MRDYLTFDGIQHDLVAYFNNNQQKAQGSNDLWAWAQVTLVGSGGPQTFTLFNAASGSPSAFGHGDYVFSGGPITLCYSKEFALAKPADIVACDGSEVDSHTFEHNIGQNDVSYAIFSAALNDLIWSDDFTEMQVRVDFQDLNNGFENLFIGAACVGPNGCTTTQVPEPATLALFGLALLGMGFGRFLRASAKG